MFFFKQWGEHDETGAKVGKKVAGRVLDGRTHDAVPEVDRELLDELFHPVD